MRIVSVLSYLLGLGSMAYFFWFIQFEIDTATLPFSWKPAIFNVLIFLLFPLQHSVLARERAKRIFHPLFPQRSFYVATSGIVMWLILLLWQRTGPRVYDLSYSALFDAIFCACIVLIILCTLQLNHAEMFGLTAVKETRPSLKTTGVYGFVRHPITTLLLIALWSHETMTTGRLLFNVLFSVYAILGTRLEESDLRQTFGNEYETYAKRVPAFIPWPRRSMHGN